MKKAVLFSVFVFSFLFLSAQNNFSSKTKSQYAQNHNIVAKYLHKKQLKSSPKANPKEACNVQDSLALVALYNSTGGSTDWTNKTGWLLDSVYKWFGVGLDANGRVNQLSLNGNNLTKLIPSEIKNLTNLQYLDLSHNSLTDTIPSSIGNLTNLRYLNLNNNKLSDSIPSTIGNMTNLLYLDLSSDTLLSGNIPSAIGKLKNLIYLDFSRDKIYGHIPAEIENLKNLQYLYLNENNLTGSIPPIIGNLKELQKLYLQDNFFSGTIPTQIGNLTMLQELYLGGNKLSGNIPPEIKNLTNLYRFFVDNNQLSGNIPPVIWTLTELKILNLEGNQFSGHISTQIGNLTNLQELYIEKNNFTGSIPTQLGKLTKLQKLYSEENQFDSIPDLSSLNNLSICFIRNNNFDFGDLQTANILASDDYEYFPQHNIGDTTYFKFVAGNDYSFYDSVGGTGNQYQWYKDGNIISGETNPSLKISNATSSDAGKYYCKITNPNFTSLTLQTQPFILNTSVFSVTFSVLDNNSSPIENAQIHIQNWNNSLFTDASGKNSTNLGTGNYTAIVSKTGFVNDTTAFSVTNKDENINITLQAVTAIPQNTANRIVIYPNPASDNFFVKNAENSVMTITDMFGRNVFRTKLNSNNENISTNNLQSGIYLININLKKSVFQTKIIIK